MLLLTVHVYVAATHTGSACGLLGTFETVIYVRLRRQGHSAGHTQAKRGGRKQWHKMG